MKMKVDLTMFCKPATIPDCPNGVDKLFSLDKTDVWSESGLAGKVCVYDESYPCWTRDFVGKNNKSNGFNLLKNVVLDGDDTESMDKAVILYMREWRKRIALALKEAEHNLKCVKIWFHYHDTVMWKFSLTTNVDKLYRRK